VPLELFLRGLAIGFAVAFALGPIGLLVIKRTVDRGWLYGFLSGTGVATADATYGAIAAFGLTAITELLVGIDRWLGIIGGTALLLLAAKALRDARSKDVATARTDPGRLATPLGGWASMVALTLTNPATILSFAALFASIGAGTGGAGGAAAVVAGVFLGSVAWWAILTGVVARLRARMTRQAIRWLNVASAVIIGGFGVAAIVLGVAAG
jgi:threonine/homoserine/homoserine lactone efflux protein